MYRAMLSPKLNSLSLIALIALSLIILGFAPPEAAPPGTEPALIPGRKVYFFYNEQATPHYIPPPEEFAVGIQTATIIVNFNPATCQPEPGQSLIPWPAAAQNAFSFATGIWESLLTSNQTIVVNACWFDTLGPGVLGGASPGDFIRDFPGAPLANTWYPIGLANALSNNDLNNTGPEVFADFSAAFDWYFGTDGNVSPFELDFISVVLHEVGHGLGFTGLMNVNGGIGSWGFGSGFPGIYDQFTEDNGGAALLSYPNNSAALGTALTSNAVFFNGSNANAANGNSRVRLYAPGSWSSGSSYSHLDEIFNGTPNSLMTFSLGNGEVEHNPGPVMLCMFKDMGWTASQTCTAGPALILTKNASRLLIESGQRLTYTLTVENGGGQSASNLVITDTLPSNVTLDLTTLSGDAAATGTGPGDKVVWTTGASLAQNEKLNRTFAVTVGVTLGLITNNAQASAANASLTSGSVTSRVAATVYDTFLPLILK